MNMRKAGMSEVATALYQSLLEAGVEVPQRETLGAYRDAVREDTEADIQAATSTFAGNIETIDIAGVSCRQLTPQGWNEHDDQTLR